MEDMGLPFLVIDADDTLWESSLFFERAEDDFIRLMESAGADGESARALVHRRDMERLEMTGFGARPYIETLSSVMSELIREPSASMLRSFEDIAACLMDHPVLLYPGTARTLGIIRASGIRTVVYTMGRADHQTSKFERSGTSDLVTALEVVERKTAAGLAALLQRYGVEPSGAVCVGNSPRSDVNPALAVGARAVLLSRDRLWAAEREEIADPGGVTVISSLTELPGILGIQSGGTGPQVGERSSPPAAVLP